MPTSPISPLQAPALLAPLLLALPGAAISTKPAPAILPLLSPILRQRVQIFSATSSEPWLKLLCYDTSKGAKLQEIIQGGSLEPHPVSGEVEVDWELDSESRFRRLDEETLQAFVAVPSLGLAFQLVHCVNDKEGGGDGWRIGEVTSIDGFSPFASFDGHESISAAEQSYKDSKTAKGATLSVNGSATANGGAQSGDPSEDDDDDYWDRYDATPARTPAARTPATKRSPAPQSLQSSGGFGNTSAAEDAYFAQYDDVQPAMDNHDPDEEHNIEALAPSLGLNRVASHPTQESPDQTELSESTGAWTLAEPERSSPGHNGDHVGLAHPRPSSSASSSKGSDTVAKLEETAERQVQSEFGVKQHVSRSIRSLFLLSRASGIDREEFENMVRTELDLLGMIEGED
ncbi:hypothetical protein jhhlp_001292 [Lomentospora prolificans]|uniref:Uncharacterized protein n=1 Tax=Lomentospora prolificans TaxID=41688 RepID=A0A2N3NHQ4_9PEZI|nr:hypothetical protein jhhlp_001292 [Lomentospora prolificans]